MYNSPENWKPLVLQQLNWVGSSSRIIGYTDWLIRIQVKKRSTVNKQIKGLWRNPDLHSCTTNILLSFQGFFNTIVVAVGGGGAAAATGGAN